MPAGADCYPQWRDQSRCGLYGHRLTPAAAGPKRLPAIWRGHWGIEHRVHRVRDVTFDEDRCQKRCGPVQQVAAALRNAVISLLRCAGHRNIAEALRRNDARPKEALALIGVSCLSLL